MNTDKLKPTQRFWRLLKPDNKEIKNVYIYAVFAGLVSLSLPLGIQAIINLIQGGQISTSWIILVVIVIAGTGLAGILQIFQLRITENLQQKIFTRASFEFAYRIPRIRLDELYKQYAPELANRFFDTLTVQKGLSKILIDFSTASLQIFFGLVLLSLYHPFFIIFSFTLVLLIVVIVRYTAQKGLQTSLKESKQKYKIAHWLEEIARNNITFKLSGQSSIPLSKTNIEVDKYIDYRESHFKILVQQYSLMIAFKVLVATGLLAIGGVLVFQQQMNIGQFVGAEIIILLVLGSVEKLIMSMETIYDVLTGLEKMGQVTDLELESRDGNQVMPSECENGLDVELEDIVFQYPGHHQETLSHLNLKIKGGESIMITGGNSSGKSTLLSIISGLYDVQFGNLSYNGLPKGNIDINFLRLMIGNCVETEKLFEGTLLENISLGRSHASFDNVKWATNIVGLNDYVKQLPKGYDSVLNPDNQRTPRSIVEKIILARSIVHKPKLLLLKDVLHSFVEKEREEVINFLVNPENKWTLVAISNSRDLAQKVDRIIVLENGKLKHTGTYEELKSHLKLKG
jgi:ABC-type bacteriocin/lantibiotic exporter with double-glycine peptidase domain